MVLGKSCAFYQNSKCIFKGTPCDLACTEMGHDEEEHGELPKPLSQAEKRVFFYLKRSQCQAE